MTIGNFTPKNASVDYISRCDHIREHDNYLDEETKTVSVQQTETFEVLYNQSLYAVVQSLS
jgi:hypothetical protein